MTTTVESTVQKLEATAISNG